MVVVMALLWMIAPRRRKQNMLMAAPAGNSGRSGAMKWQFSPHLATLFVLFCGLFTCQAQEKPEQSVPTLHTQSNVVLAPALVKDQAGKLIFGLQAKDFIIEDDGVPQEVKMDEAEPEA